MVFVRNILMDGIVRETRKRKVAAREKDLSFIGRREFLDAIEDLGGLFLVSIQTRFGFSLCLCVSVVNQLLN